MSLFESLHPLLRIGAIAGLAVVAHFGVRFLRRLGEWVIEPKGAVPADFAKHHPKVATITTLLTSAVTFVVYFVALGLLLAELNISLTAYLATASVLGLAVGFGSQGLVQDVVIGVTFVFTDAFDVGDMVEVSGQVGRVERIGLRFTELRNFHGQRVFVPNRNIALVGRYRRGVVRAYVDTQIPEGQDPEAAAAELERLAQGMRAQYKAVIVADPEVFGVFDAAPGGWRYVRVKFRLWPGQTQVIESVFRQRVIAAMKRRTPDYAEWMVSVTYRVI